MKDKIKWYFDAKWLLEIKENLIGIILAIFTFLVMGQLMPSIILNDTLDIALFLIAWVLACILMEMILKIIVMVLYSIISLLDKKRG